MTSLESRPHATGDALSTIPVLVGGVSMVSASAIAVLWVVDAFGRDYGGAVFAAGLIAWGCGAAFALVGGLVAGLRAGVARADDRTFGLPASGVMLALVVGLAAVVLPVGVGIGALVRPAAPQSMAMYAVPFTAPWSGMALPVGPGAILYSDASTTTIVYQNGPGVAKAAGPFESRIRALGWTQTFRDTSGGMITCTYAKSGSTLTLAVMDAAGITTVSMTTI